MNAYRRLYVSGPATVSIVAAPAPTDSEMLAWLTARLSKCPLVTTNILEIPALAEGSPESLKRAIQLEMTRKCS